MFLISIEAKCVVLVNYENQRLELYHWKKSFGKLSSAHRTWSIYLSRFLFNSKDDVCVLVQIVQLVVVPSSPAAGVLD